MSASSTRTETAGGSGGTGGVFRWAIDRALAVGYGLVYDYIFERFGPYQGLQREVLGTVRAAAADAADPRRVYVLDIGCGPGNFSLMLAEAGFTVLGIDAYEPLVTLAQEKRRARQLPNLAFKQVNLVRENPLPPDRFDQLLNVHFLYAHPDPDLILREAFRVLAPGGHGLFVNLTRRVQVRSTFRTLRERAGWKAALESLLWVLPNAVFETIRRRTGPHYWDEAEFAAHLRAAGFEVTAMRPTFFDQASLLACVRKPAAPVAAS